MFTQKLSKEDVEWIVNDKGELGVMINNQAFFLYKGESFVYEDGLHDDSRPMQYRPVFKREFGECCYPINDEDPTRIGKVSLDDSPNWKELPRSEGSVHGWNVMWPQPDGSHSPIYVHGDRKPTYGKELDAILEIYPVYK